MHLYHRKPIQVKKIDTKYRKIITALPVPQSIPILEKLEHYEPQSMLGQPPLIWDRAEGFQVFEEIAFLTEIFKPTALFVGFFLAYLPPPTSKPVGFFDTLSRFTL